ncbi:hypothetical protein [Bradyrhizobium sp. CCBAU 51753]|uniref:Abi-alpha family protein n=1 Tax=Bradyrhizobium sp. CCBAU 51753 TaxID=1325100 RepID=UPI00188CAEC9|nr:hypothetical protein [Bradyrhizobium sp. CCBAU 51753]
MAKKKRPAANVRGEAVAKAEVVAKAIYQRKHSTTQVIPPDVTRAKAGAWLTLISPITEWAGLKGDQLRHKRDLLRIQQEATLNRIAELANDKIAQEGRLVAAVPTKFLVPFLERASLEDGDSELCDRWSDLLVSAAGEYDPSMIRFSAVLAEIGSGEVQLLNRLVRKARGSRGLTHIEDVPHIFVQSMLGKFVDNNVKSDVADGEKRRYHRFIRISRYCLDVRGY